MSYCIEYGRQFIKSEEGITPCWLHGDNNVSDIHVGPSGRSTERRSRDWSVFQNMLGTTEAALLAEVEKWMNGPYEEHWKRHGKWVDDAALRRWVITGCKNAATVEDILAANPAIRSLHCYCSVWRGYNCAIENEVKVKTTEELDQWIRDVKKQTSVYQNVEYFPIIDFGTESLKAPLKPQRDGTEPCLIKCRSNYLIEIIPGLSTTTKWSPNKHMAQVFTRTEAESLLPYMSSLRNVRIISAKDRMSQPFNAVLYFTDSMQKRKYISQRRRRRIYLCDSPDIALHYPNAAAAEKAVKELQPKYPGLGQLAVEIISDN